jgi:TusA-related sulfurtransferase
VDAKGVHCPLPILKAKKALAEMESGQILRVLATDPGSQRDFQAFCKQTGHTLLEQQQEGDVLVHYVVRR